MIEYEIIDTNTENIGDCALCGYSNGGNKIGRAHV